ncbi:MAG: 50S ribosomal protein L3 [Acidimicrobiales bacterium]
MATKSIVGEKVGMTQLWDDQNRVIAVTMVKVAPMRVVRVKRVDTDGYNALQVTFGFIRPGRLNLPERGHFNQAGVEPGRQIVELRIDDVSAWEVGSQLDAGVFAEGDLVDVRGVSKGKGFTGVMKRHNFKGLPASHGAHGTHRTPGSIGACATPARVFKGTRMAGHSGHQQVTTLNLRVVKADAERELLLIKGAVPGPRGGLVVVRDAVRTTAGQSK